MHDIIKKLLIVLKNSDSVISIRHRTIDVMTGTRNIYSGSFDIFSTNSGCGISKLYAINLTLIENPAFLDGYSGFENLKILASIKEKVNDDEIKDIIAKVGLNPDDKKKYRKYSLGMKQRLGIAAALMENPDLVILDEPTNALDSDGIETVKKLIAEQKAKGSLVILSCHDFSILESLSDEIISLECGKIKSNNRSDRNEK